MADADEGAGDAGRRPEAATDPVAHGGPLAAAYREIVELTSEGIAIVDAGRRIVFANRALAEMLGYRPEALLGRPYLDFYAEASRSGADERWASCREDRPRRSEVQLVRSDGTALWAMINARPRFDAAGRPAGVLAMVTDITELKRATGELARIAADFRYLFDHHPNPMWIYDRETLRFLAVNEPALAAFGYARDEFLARLVPDLHPPEERAAAERSIRGRPPGGRRGTWKLLTRAGRTIHADLASQSMAFDGRPAVLVVAIDVTERLVAEERLRRAQQLEAIGQLTGGVAHDFNNLLTVILGNISMLAASVEHDPALAAMARITRLAAQRGADLTRRLLAFARRQPLNPVAVDANALLAGMVDLLRRTLAADIAIELHRGDALRAASADQAELEAALLDLAINARDAMPAGGRLTLRAANATLGADFPTANGEVRPGEYVAISVTDSGTGMTPDVLAHAFEPFFTTKEVGKGTGLGLAHVYGFVKQSGGQVTIDSQPGRGTTVTMYLPCAAAAAPLAAEPGRGADAPAPAAPAGTRVLLVEDDEQVRMLVARQLQRLGYRVLVAIDGPDALRKAEAAGDIDVLITDVVMPGGMNGREVAERLTAARPGLRVLYVSGYSDDVLSPGGRLDPGIRLLRKPFTVQQLAAELGALLAAPPPA